MRGTRTGEAREAEGDDKIKKYSSLAPRPSPLTIQKLILKKVKP
jgi:hypothetical protein